ncbi:uncharacterized protein BJX67DRAFT_85348 [Aspergillus lucknowensis]|uniref:Rhodopsin domain-containing protein n=1 Tax=Aspergillus lucknowensis TaxID=176173 RepID=A0ABR4LSC9_9EURO
MSSLSEPAIPAPPNEVSDLENPEDVIHTVNFATQVVCIVVVTILVALRVLIKARLRSSWVLDDYMTILGWVCSRSYQMQTELMGARYSSWATAPTCSFVGPLSDTSLQGLTRIVNHYGGGYHAWDVSKGDMINFQKASYAITLLYVPMVFVIKLALLAMMLRIFAPDRRKVLIIYASIAILVLYYIPALFIKIFFCHPISAYWYGGGKCMNQRNVIIADATISMASDFWILVLPIPMLWSLQMSLNKKLRVLGILGAGGLATGFSIWRLVMMVEESQTPDTTWFWIHCVLTANAEAGIGLICVCLPTLSSYFVSRRLKSQSRTTGSYQRSHELSSYNKLSSSKKRTDPSPSFTATRTDEAYLFSTVEADGREGSVSTTTGESHTAERRGGIHKDVVVQQSYEYVK